MLERNPLCIGTTAFSRNIAEHDEVQWSSFLKELKGIGSEHVQFLAPESEATAKTWSKMCDDLALQRSTLWCTFNPACPCANAAPAFEAAKRAIDVGRIIAGDKGVNMVCSPSMLRGLGDPNKGLVGPDDGKRQMDFIARVAAYARSIKGTKVAVEPLNRFESRGTNTLAETVKLIDGANAKDRVGILADSCHQAMEEACTITTAWENHVSDILAIHASSRSRTFLEEDAHLTMNAFRMVAQTPAFKEIPVINEAFCRETLADFFPVLGVHQPPDVTAVELFRENIAWLRKVMTM